MAGSTDIYGNPIYKNNITGTGGATMDDPLPAAPDTGATPAGAPPPVPGTKTGPYVNDITGTGGATMTTPLPVSTAPLNPAGAPPAAPNPNVDQTTPGPGSDASGQLSGPGPGEIYDATHSGDFNTPGATETVYDQHGQDPFAAPSNSQTLFNEGMAGNDPYFSYAEKMASKQINDAASARGGWNSGAAISAIGNSSDNLRGQQAMQLYGLAPQADSAERQRLAQGFDFANQNDTAKANRIGAGMGINDDWQKMQEGRLTGALDSATTLSKDKADTTSASYKSALDTYNTDGLAGIEAALQKAGINPTGDATKDFLTLVGIGAKAANA